MDDPKHLARQKATHLSSWISAAQEIHRFLPYVEKEYSIAEWEASTLSDAPTTVLGSSGGELTRALHEDLSRYREVLPLPSVTLPQRERWNMATSSSTATSSKVYILTLQARGSSDPDRVAWGQRHSQQYESLHERLGRQADARKLLERLDPGLVGEFDVVLESVAHHVAQTGTQFGAAIIMRNLLEHFQGKLMNLAREPQDQKVSWELMGQRLISDPLTRVRFTEQEARWKDLHARLTQIAKGNLSKLDASTLRSLQSELLDLIFISLSAVFPNTL